MKNFFLALLVIMAFASCETPSNIKASPDNATNTIGTTGSAVMTREQPVTQSPTLPVGTKDSLRNIPASNKDSLGNLKESTGVVKDSMPK